MLHVNIIHITIYAWLQNYEQLQSKQISIQQYNIHASSFHLIKLNQVDSGGRFSLKQGHISSYCDTQVYI